MVCAPELPSMDPVAFERRVSDDRSSESTDDTTRSWKDKTFQRQSSISTSAGTERSPSEGEDHWPCLEHSLTKVSALALQSDLLQKFSSPSFQKEKYTLVRQHMKPLAGRAALTKLVRARQMEVIPSYGFDASQEGVESMLRAFKKFETDPDIYVGSVAIQDALSLNPLDSKEKTEQKDLVIKPSTPHRVRELLRALLVEFSMASFQQDVRSLKRQVISQRRRIARRNGDSGSWEDPDGYYRLPGRGRLALQVYRVVLPCFGFEGSKAGVKDMILHCAEYMSDSEVSGLVNSINLKLGMTQEACQRWRNLILNFADEDRS
mmetsp:Transcript_47578/g.113220  ORF Transcript_47578/g.113220 Transcript_47578/m.113220 type:complete len:320 (+) Transcript_47578:44-1003(+)|eukprot:CAMPEP_0181455686 /NCGR_PEP_ID=MMETSP1110-20121109/30884_1 /TAXON_ID=174948 /ORGANISM="Symbiodinium sp., Strain CCMP421" /LENGTH=319 /DNA_ID=CAMNT_0023580075 /DNA_START=43 /DNA_END=1002 /DNA_ORIENTATION=-